MPASSSSATFRKQINRKTSNSDFLLPDEIPIDTAHTLDQLTSRFRGMRDGLPELIKNSKDQYSRLGVLDRGMRQIVVIAETERHRLAVLDFAGARSDDFEGWTTWSSREAGRIDLSNDIEAGHGNGGKAFMVRGASETAFMESCFGGKRTRMGFRNDRPSDRYKPGYAREKGLTIDNVVEAHPKTCLERFLSELGLPMAKLPRGALAAFQNRNAFTGVLLCGVTEWRGRQKRKVKRLAEEGIPAIIAGHGQTAMSIETCEVSVIVDGKLITSNPIAPIALEPYPGFEHLNSIEIPSVLIDPETGDTVDMVCGMQGQRYLQLSTSARQLQMSDETKARNVIRLWNLRNNVANWPLQSLGVQITSVSFIYGQIRCPALVGEHLSGAERIHLNDTPFVRALEEWTRQQVRNLAEDLHRAMMAENRPRDREQAKSALQSIRELMRQYLDADAASEQSDEEERENEGNGIEGQGRKKKRKRPGFGERIDRIILEQGRPSIVIALGTSVPIRSRCEEIVAAGEPVPVVAKGLMLCSSEPNIVSIRKDSRLVADSVGKSEIWLETADGRVSSNKISCEVILATDVSALVPEDTLLQGQRITIQMTFQTANGPRDDVLIDGSIDEPGMGLLGRSGRFTAGSKEGQATVRVRFGASAPAQRTAVIHIGPDRVPLTDSHGSRGSDIPEILLCGDKVPGMEEYPEEQRTLAGGEELPTIIEDPLFQNVVWINPTSKESMRVRGGRGSTGVGRIASKNFMQFITLKCFEVLKRLHVRQALKGKTVTEFEFIQSAAYAEIECADFIDAAWEMSEELLSRAEANGVQ
jgi:hypothetical protein